MKKPNKKPDKRKKKKKPPKEAETGGPAHYRCCRCNHEWWDEIKNVSCIKCNHAWVKWLNFEELICYDYS